MAVKYPTDHYLFYDDYIPIPYSYVMSSCVFWFKTYEVYDFEVPYDPSYLNLDPNDENSWKIYAEKVRDIYSKCLKIPKSEAGYRDWKGFC